MRNGKYKRNGTPRRSVACMQVLLLVLLLCVVRQIRIPNTKRQYYSYGQLAVLTWYHGSEERKPSERHSVPSRQKVRTESSKNQESQEQECREVRRMSWKKSSEVKGKVKVKESRSVPPDVVFLVFSISVFLRISVPESLDIRGDLFDGM